MCKKLILLVFFQPRDVSYELVAISLAAEVLKMNPSHVNSPQLVQLTRIYVPSLRRHFHHSVFAIEVSSKQFEKVSFFSFFPLHCIPIGNSMD